MFKFGLLLISILFSLSYNIFGDTIRGTSGEKIEKKLFPTNLS